MARITRAIHGASGVSAPVFSLLLILLAVTVSQVRGQDYPDREEMIRQLEAWAESQTGNIDIRARVVSTDGQPLSDVIVGYSVEELGDVVAGKKEEQESMQIDGEFRITRENISLVSLWVGKLGYYTQRWSFNFNEETPRTNPGGYETVNLEFVLEKQPEPAPLEKYEGGLRADAYGPMSVFFPTNKRLPDGKPANRDVLSLPPEDSSFPYLFLSATVAPGGELATRLFPRKNYSHPKPVLSHGFVRIAGASEGDGFLPVDIGEIPPLFERGFRNLQRAPENHYSESLELNPVEGKEKQFFYCRIGGLYGKGVVTNPPIILEKDGREFAITNVIIFLNLTGSTDVSYIHH